MTTFRKFLENGYPGAYYDQEGNLVQHFAKKEDKEKWDQDPSNDTTGLEYKSDKRVKKDQLVTNAKVGISKYAVPIASTALKTALGDGLLSEVPIEQIENNAERLQEELIKVNQALNDIRKAYLAEKDAEKKKKLEDAFIKASERKKKLSDAYRRYQEREYV